MFSTTTASVDPHDLPHRAAWSIYYDHGDPRTERISSVSETNMPLPSPAYPRISLILLDPLLSTENQERLSQYLDWNDPDRLAEAFIAAMRQASYGLVNYQVAERIHVQRFLPMADGFAYTASEYLRCWRARRGFHQPDRVDYNYLLSACGLLDKIRRGEIDEAWTIGHPYAGFYESRMAGPGAFWCNAPPLEGAERAGRRFIIMAFNCERGLGEMLESYGHRAEAIMEHVYRDIPASHNTNLWRRFTRYDGIAPGRAEVGSIHFAPNSERDYDWGNRRKVLSRSRAWYDFPDLSAPPRLENCAEWGGGDIYAHHLWWFRHLPHVSGQTGGVSNNWWGYIGDPDNVQLKQP
ncbi:MAG: hypothetical protein JXA78_18695 [Anaerolineales bacterium]|nr:hypothetical protein [Anaerolineales bacterium]